MTNGWPEGFPDSSYKGKVDEKYLEDAYASKAIFPAWNQKIARALGTVVVDSRMSVPASMDRKTYIGS